MTTSAYVLIIGLLVAIIAISIWQTTPSSDDTETPLIANRNEDARTPKPTQPSQPVKPVQPVRPVQPTQPIIEQPVVEQPVVDTAPQSPVEQPRLHVAPVAPPCRFPLSHTVKPGETCTSIAKKYYNCDGAGTTHLCVLHIGKANSGVNVNNLSIGQKLTIPALTVELAARIGGTAPTAVTSVEPVVEPLVARTQGPDLGAYKIYIVKRGDSIIKIARVQLGNEDKAEQLFELNKRLGLMEKINDLRAGQQIVLGYK